MAFVLAHKGFKHVRALKGGYNAWLEANGETVPKPADQKQPEHTKSEDKK